MSIDRDDYTEIDNKIRKEEEIKENEESMQTLEDTERKL